MKKVFFLLSFVMVLSVAALAQVPVQQAAPAPPPPPVKPASQPKFYLNGILGYTFDEKFDVGGWPGNLVGAMHYGGSIEYSISKMASRYSERTVELSYQGASQDLERLTYQNYQKQTMNVGTNYVTLGVNNYAGRSRKFMGYGGFNLGIGWMEDKDSDNSSGVNFAWGLKAGARAMFNEKVGLKLYAQINSIVGGVGGGLYFGSGGASAGISTYASVTQFGLGGGLTVGLGGSK